MKMDSKVEKKYSLIQLILWVAAELLIPPGTPLLTEHTPWEKSWVCLHFSLRIRRVAHFICILAKQREINENKNKPEPYRIELKRMETKRTA